jgi:tetratricopeptide (TPR) repeat protein
MAVTLPVVLILIDYYNRRNYNKKILLEKIPYFIFAIVFGVITIYIQSTAENINKTSFIGLQNIRNASFAVIFYLIKLFIPTKLSCLYPYPNKIGGFYSFIYPYSIIILGIIILLIIYYQRNDRSVIFGLMFFIITISPVIQLLPVGRTIVADRYTYIPYIGLFYVIIEKLHLLQKEKINYFITLILLTILFYFASLTNNRCKIWSDSITLWTTDIKAYPELDKVAYNNLGNAYSDAGDYEKAISVYNRVISIDSQYTDAYLNRGNAYLKKGDYEKAINDYNTVIKLNPNHAKAYLHRASAYTYKKEYDKAIIDFNKAIELKPNFASFYYNRAVFYAIIKEYDKSISDYTKAIENNPKYIDAYINRGAIYTQKKEYDKAILDYTRVIELNPNYSLAYYNRAIAYNKKGEIDKAKSDFESFKRLETNKKSIK